jgi:YjbE family integral membrane protein
MDSMAFGLALLKIIWVNILLSGDNAVVIALAARALPENQQKKAIVIGSGAAILMRIVLTLVASELLQLPWLKVIGAILLIYIGVSLVMPEGDEDDGKQAHSTLMAAIRTILIADLVMSIDNVVGVAAAASGNTVLLVLGLVISIPMVIFGSTVLLKVIERFPVIVWLGAALLGWIAGDLFINDSALHPDIMEAAIGMSHHAAELAMGILGAIIVVALGRYFIMRHKAKGESGNQEAA